MIEAFIASASAGLVVSAIAWRQRRLKRLKEQLEFVEQFSVAYKSISHDPSVPDSVKNFLRFASSVIDSTEAARFLFSAAGPRAEARRSPILAEIRGMPHYQQERLFAAVRCFLMALSYQIGGEGYKFRAVLSGVRGEKTVKVEMAKIAGFQPVRPGMMTCAAC